MRWPIKIMYRVGESLHGWSVLRRLEELDRMQYWPAERLDQFKFQRLRSLLDHAYRNVPFYRRLWDSCGCRPEDCHRLESLTGFPVVTKSMLREAGREALDQSAPRRSLLRGQSGGSTGEPLVYYVTPEHQSWFIASAFQGWRWAGWELGQPWVRLQSRGRLSPRARLEDRLANCLYMPIDRLDISFVRQFLPKILRHRPALIRGYSGGTYILAKFLLEMGELRVRPGPWCAPGTTCTRTIAPPSSRPSRARSSTITGARA